MTLQRVRASGERRLVVSTYINTRSSLRLPLSLPPPPATPDRASDARHQPPVHHPSPSLSTSTCTSLLRETPTRRVLVREQETPTEPKETRKPDRRRNAADGLGRINLVPEHQCCGSHGRGCSPDGIVVWAHVPHHTLKVGVDVDDGVWCWKVLYGHCV